MSRIEIIPELPGRGRLGRHLHHDDRSRAFAAPSSGKVASAIHVRHCVPFDQGELGSCTGNAMAGLLMTEPFYDPARVLGEADAVALYESATKLDEIPGHYPPDDTGSTGLAVAKAAAKRGMIGAYHHAFGLHEAIVALTKAPIVVGIGWYDGFDEPRFDCAELRISGQVRGGHEVELLQVDLEHGYVRGCNSWGEGWGNLGYFVLSFSTFGRLLKEGGDATAPVPLRR